MRVPTTVRFALLLLLLLLMLPSGARAEDGHAAWLRYARLEPQMLQRTAKLVPAWVTVVGDAPPMLRARDELVRGVSGMLGRPLRVEN